MEKTVDFERVRAWGRGEIECPLEIHPEVAGPNMDLGQCRFCGAPMGVKRSVGESFGWHIADCSLDFGHAGRCIGGGEGHAVPRGWKFRG